MISSKNFSPSSILLSHSPGPPGVRSLHQNPVPLTIGELTLTETCFIFVGQLDMRVEEPLHLVAQPHARAADGSYTQLAHEPGERGSQDQLAGLGPHRFGAYPGQQQAGEIAEGQPGLAHGRHDQGVEGR